MKEQTPMTADENLIYAKIGGCLRNQESEYVVKVVSDLMEQYAQAKVLEALEREVPKAHELGQQYMDRHGDYFEGEAIDYYETEVKPRYKD